MAQKAKKKIFVGKVISDKMNKTITVKIDRMLRDARFHKITRVTKKYKVHDEKSEARVGDIIEFCEGRPLSKTKHMYLNCVVKTQA